MVQSIDRAFAVLSALAIAPAGVTDLSARTELPKSTVARLLATLEGLHAVERADGGRYRIGLGLLHLAGAVDASAGLASAVIPHLRGLAHDLGEAAGFSVPTGYSVHYLAQVESPNAVQVRDYTGLDFEPRSPASLYWTAQCRRAGHVLTPSEFARREVMEFLGHPPERVSATPLAVHEHFRREPRPPEAREALLRRMGIRPPFLLYVGGYERHKNTEGLLDAFRRVRESRPDVRLVLVGTKSLPEALKARVERLGLRPGRPRSRSR